MHNSIKWEEGIALADGSFVSDISTLAKLVREDIKKEREELRNEGFSLKEIQELVAPIPKSNIDAIVLDYTIIELNSKLGLVWVISNDKSFV